MRLSRSLAALGVLAVACWAGCGGGVLTANPGTAGSGGGVSTGAGGGERANMISDFEDGLIATVVHDGGRNGYWYAYNDGNPSCVQRPLPGSVYAGAPPPTPSPSSSSLALHADWQGCDLWGAGVGADFAVPSTSGITYSGPKVAYDVTGFAGVTFFAMGATEWDAALRVQFPMRSTTRVEDGGLCDEAVVGGGRCGDEWGARINLPAGGTWKQFTVRFSDAAFAQAGWGAAAPWNPADVTGIHLQAYNKADPYDFWIDDVYFVR